MVFDEDIIISNVSKSGNNLTMTADTWQLFEGCRITEGVQRCYRDATKKSFIINYNLDTSSIGRTQAAIDEIGVKDTKTLESFMKEVKDNFKFRYE